MDGVALAGPTKCIRVHGLPEMAGRLATRESKAGTRKLHSWDIGTCLGVGSGKAVSSGNAV